MNRKCLLDIAWPCISGHEFYCIVFVVDEHCLVDTLVDDELVSSQIIVDLQILAGSIPNLTTIVPSMLLARLGDVRQVRF